LRLTNTSDPSECSFGSEDIRWRIDDEGLHLHLVATASGFVEIKSFFEAKVWQKIADQ